jgi:hypothetical protein
MCDDGGDAGTVTITFTRCSSTPSADTLVNAYSPDPFTQQAVVEWLFGELKAEGTSPVDLERPARVRELIAREWGK